MALERRARIGEVGEHVKVNVWCLATKTIVFTGCKSEVANWLGVATGVVNSYIRTKSRFRKKYALRIAPVGKK